MKLTKTQAIEEHRKMWNWIADETEKRQECVFKNEYLQKFYPDTDIRNDCFLCDCVPTVTVIDLGFTPVLRCDKCPLNWGSGGCMDGTSLYIRWRVATGQLQVDGVKNSWKRAARYAREIANLKEKGNEKYGKSL